VFPAVPTAVGQLVLFSSWLYWGLGVGLVAKLGSSFSGPASFSFCGTCVSCLRDA
jgi:hypothetical protein